MYRVFIVDDEMWVVIGLKKLIEKSELPFRVIGEANNGVTALDEIRRLKPEVLIADIRMPGFNGIELIKKLNDDGLSTIIIFVSGYAEFEYAQEAIRMKAFDYLLKPIDQEKLNEVLLRVQELYDASEVCQDDFIEETMNKSLLSQIIEEIKESYTTNITLTALAEKYVVSISHLSKQIKEELGLSFSEYITARRIQKAKELLLDESLTIDSIAEQVGFNDYFYFIKVFKKSTGISPSKYRKNI